MKEERKFSKRKLVILSALSVTVMLGFQLVAATAWTTHNTILGLRISEASNTIWEMNNEDSQSYSFKIGCLTVTLAILETERHLYIIFDNRQERSYLEFLVEPVKDGWRTTIRIDGLLLIETIYSTNIIASLRFLESTEQYTLSDVPRGNPITASYSFRWWDGIYMVTGPSYLIKYHHPDRDYYQIATWMDWSRTGNEVVHNQINSITSGYIIPGGWAALFAAVAAYLAYPAGAGAQAVAALFAGLFGAIFGYVTAAQLGDETGCIWWWWGRDFDAWFWANWWWIVPLGPQWFIAIVEVQLNQIGYFRVGDYTFVDPQRFGNP
ncbi:MAG: hypothetical protein JW779_11875 [Candidatus Thorarchaeota archaeon]|nr:hypothetical protein [Candidatus Thorarchaeota archaeon]